MTTKIFRIDNLLTIKIETSDSVLKNFANYFPDILEINKDFSFDYQIIYHEVDAIPDIYIKFDRNYKIVYPFRNLKYIIRQIDGTILAYAEKQEFSDENVVIRDGKIINIFAKNDKRNKNLVRLITELLVRKLLENKYFPLHASCVVDGDGAMLYLGDKRSGKSTALFSSVLITKAFPLANDITFVGKADGMWKAFGTSYDLTFDKSLSEQIIKDEISFEGHNCITQFSSSKIRYNPLEFCRSFKTNWKWSAPIKSINISNLSPTKAFKETAQIDHEKALEYLIKYGRDENFSFDDMLMINGLYPNFDYEQLSKDVIINEIEGNILEYQRRK